MKCVYLLGTDHRYQRGAAHGVADVVFDEFRQMLSQAVADHKITGIAEEMNKKALGTANFTGKSLACELASELKIRHAYCDPEKEDRLRLNITAASQRETYWLEKLREFNIFPVLFILGATHVESFKCLLETHGFDVKILISDWEPDTTLKQ